MAHANFPTLKTADQLSTNASKGVAMTRQALSHYPTKAQISRAVESARLAGIDVAGLEVTRDGTIRIIDGRSSAATVEDEIAQWEKAGKLA